jgi:hypothetical protein
MRDQTSQITNLPTPQLEEKLGNYYSRSYYKPEVGIPLASFAKLRISDAEWPPSPQIHQASELTVGGQTKISRLALFFSIPGWFQKAIKNTFLVLRHSNECLKRISGADIGSEVRKPQYLLLMSILTFPQKDFVTFYSKLRRRGTTGSARHVYVMLLASMVRYIPNNNKSGVLYRAVFLPLSPQ